MPRPCICKKQGFPYLSYLLKDGSQPVAEEADVVLINMKYSWGYLMTLKIFLFK